MEWGTIIVLSDYCIFIIVGRFHRLWKYDNSNSILCTFFCVCVMLRVFVSTGNVPFLRLLSYIHTAKEAVYVASFAFTELNVL